MTMVVDINCMARVFSTNPEDQEFRPVFNFFNDGIGKLIYGGTKYMEELQRCMRYAKIVRLMRDRGDAVRISDEAVDKAHKELEQKLSGSDCDDPHIIALLASSNCGLLCSLDARSYQYIKDPSHYPRDHVGVKIYTGSRNTDLLTRQRQNIWNQEE